MEYFCASCNTLIIGQNLQKAIKFHHNKNHIKNKSSMLAKVRSYEEKSRHNIVPYKIGSSEISKVSYEADFRKKISVTENNQYIFDGNDSLVFDPEEYEENI